MNPDYTRQDFYKQLTQYFCRFNFAFLIIGCLYVSHDLLFSHPAGGNSSDQTSTFPLQTAGFILAFILLSVLNYRVLKGKVRSHWRLAVTGLVTLSAIFYLAIAVAMFFNDYAFRNF